MPLVPYAKLLMSIAGGGVVSGGQTIAGNQTVQLSGESSSQWNTQLWEIYEYPIGFSLPAGWTNVNGIYQSTAVIPPIFTILGSTTWGKYLFRLTVNDGLLNGVFHGADSSQPLIDESSGVQVLSTSGAHDICFGEKNQFDSQRQWIGELKKSLRIFAASGIPIDVPYNGASTTPIVEYTDSGATLRSVISAGAGNRLDFGDGTLQTHVVGSFISVDSGARFLFGLRVRTAETAAATLTITVDVDYLVVATPGCSTVKLPAGPGNGDSYEIANQTGGNITVDGNGINIYTAAGLVATQMFVNAEVGVYRYNAGAVSGNPNWTRVA